MADNKRDIERAELHRTIWNIANDLRGSVDGWDFKQYVLGMLFYRYISENLTNYINKGEWEAGDIAPYGYGILTPKLLSAETTSSNKERITKKLNAGKFGKLQAGDIIIAPVRTYQKKIAVVTPQAESFLYSKDFIVLRKIGKPDIVESFKLFLKLIDEENIQLLSSMSSTGKSGYPKIKEKQKLLTTEFYDKDVPINEVKKLFKLYNDIYKQLIKKEAVL